MKVECPTCHAAYNIPDERLSSGKKIAFPCPACKGTIQIDLESGSADDVNPPSQGFQEEGEKPSGEALKKLILRSVSDLPPMPQTVFKAREIIEDPKSSFKELAEVLKTDQAIATKILKIANSAYYGIIGGVSSIQQAAVVLGHKTLGDVITVAGSSGILSNTLEGYGLEAGEMWRHSMGVAFGSQIIATRKNPSLVSDAFAAGLIHDVGKLILDRYIFERKETFDEFMADGRSSFLIAEAQILGFDHSEIAAELCTKWRVPDALTKAIRYHHYPSKSEGDELAYIVNMADTLSMMAGLGLGVDGLRYRMDEEAEEFLGLEEEDTNDIMTEVVESVEKISEQMQ